MDETTEFLNHFSGLVIPERTGDFLLDIQSVYLSNQRPDTLAHVTGVAVEIDQLARRFRLDPETCRVCAFCHDLAAILKPGEMLGYDRHAGMPLDPAEVKHPFLLHQRFSAILAHQMINIDTTEVLSAVACHSTLKAHASQLDMALFLADKLAWDQPGTPSFARRIREALEQSLSQGCRVYIEYAFEHGMILLPHRQLTEALGWLQSSNSETNESGSNQ